MALCNMLLVWQDPVPWQMGPSKTARIYIDQATAEIGSLLVPAWGKSRMERAVNGLPSLIRAFCEAK